MYQPKLNKEALILGYTGMDPKKLGAKSGYLARLTKSKNIKQNSKQVGGN